LHWKVSFAGAVWSSDPWKKNVAALLLLGSGGTGVSIVVLGAVVSGVVTVSVAAFVVAVPQPLLKTARYCLPLSPL
jgi:hypothetical protein